MKKETERQLEESYNHFKPYKKNDKLLHEMCCKCGKWCGKEHNYDECRKMTKDECVKALNGLYFSYGTDGRDDECYNVLMELIDEHFIGQPLKREEDKK